MKFGNPGSPGGAVTSNVDITGPVDNNGNVLVSVTGQPLSVDIASPLDGTGNVLVDVTGQPISTTIVGQPSVENRRDLTQPVSISQAPNVPVYGYQARNLNTGFPVNVLPDTINNPQQQWAVIYKIIINLPTAISAAGTLDLSISRCNPAAGGVQQNIFSKDLPTAIGFTNPIILDYPYGILCTTSPNTSANGLMTLNMTSGVTLTGYIRMSIQFIGVSSPNPPNLGP